MSFGDIFSSFSFDIVPPKSALSPATTHDDKGFYFSTILVIMSWYFLSLALVDSYRSSASHQVLQETQVLCTPVISLTT